MRAGLTLSCYSIQITPCDVEQQNSTQQSLGHNYLRSADESYFTILLYPRAQLFDHILTGPSPIFQALLAVVIFIAHV